MDAPDWNLPNQERDPLVAQMYIHLARAIDRHRTRLLYERRSGDLMEIAWLARNLLELKICVEYCSLSRINTLEFHKDAIRDLVDLNLKIGGLDKQTADELEAAKAFLCGKRLSKKYKKVEDAAQDTNLKPFYDNYCKILSKFVHPTALSLTFPEGGEEVVRAEFVKVGKQLAAEALEKLDTSCVGELYRKYLPTMQKLAQSHPGNDFFLGLHKP